ncbi:50S ribosomal protein L19 [bacterium BMS3Abin03]|jgi:large subunit ribosomal protein L19|nr:50S ribosomal protein L19 [bacterium BMS3Abin03]MCG6961316.1 50S ribosomal protein L19 [bacterium BMS3Abin03]
MELAMVDINKVVPDQIRTDIPKFRSGDHIKVHVRVIEGDKERIQPFEGDVISVRGAGINRTFTVRKISSGVGVERIFRLNSPKIAKIDLLKQGDIRKAKLFYLRNLSGKAARIKSK